MVILSSEHTVCRKGENIDAMAINPVFCPYSRHSHAVRLVPRHLGVFEGLPHCRPDMLYQFVCVLELADFVVGRYKLQLNTVGY